MSEPPKSTTPAQEHSYPAPAIGSYPHQGPPYPPPPGPGSYAPPIFAYPPPPDGNHPEGQSGTAPPYMIPFPPGLVYAYPPQQPPGFGPPPTNAASSPPAIRPKRKQVKMACTNCASACKRCNEHRPCERCVKYGTEQTCVDGIRKERKKGVKRGPYKRKSKEQGEGGSFDSAEWPNGQPPSPAPPAASAAAAAAPPYAPEGYYHIYYPPSAFIPHPPDGQPGGEATPPHTNGPVMPYFIPGPYPPFHYPQMYPHPPPPGSVPPQPPTSAGSSSQPTSSPSQTSGPQLEAATINPADASHTGNAVVDPALSVPVVAGKKRSRKTGEQKTKKARTGGSSHEERGRGDDHSETQPVMSDGDNRP